MYFQRTYIKHIRVASEEGRNMSGNWNVGKKKEKGLVDDVNQTV